MEMEIAINIFEAECDVEAEEDSDDELSHPTRTVKNVVDRVGDEPMRRADFIDGVDGDAPQDAENPC